MDTILAAVVIIVLIIISTLTITFSVFQSANNLTDAWKDMESQSNSIRDTDISVAGNYSGELINVTVQNEGGTNLYEYPSWDVIIQYQSGLASHLSYTETYTPGSGEWTKQSILMSGGSPEIFDPNILNPGEAMIVTINPDMLMVSGETARIVISTPNGVTSQCFVTK